MESPTPVLRQDPVLQLLVYSIPVRGVSAPIPRPPRFPVTALSRVDAYTRIKWADIARLSLFPDSNRSPPRKSVYVLLR